MNDTYQRTRHAQLNRPTLEPPANGINYPSLFIDGLIFRTFLFIYSCQQRFCFICSTLLIVELGWVGLMSAPGQSLGD